MEPCRGAPPLSSSLVFAPRLLEVPEASTLVCIEALVLLLGHCPVLMGHSRCLPRLLLSFNGSCCSPGTACPRRLRSRSILCSPECCRVSSLSSSSLVLHVLSLLLVCLKSYKRLRRLLCPASGAFPPTTRRYGPSTSLSSRNKAFDQRYALAQVPIAKWCLTTP